MPTLSCFADEISADFSEQLDVMDKCGLKYLDLRSAWETGVMDLSQSQLTDIRNMTGDRGIQIAAIGSPIGKTTIDNPAMLELDRVKHAADLAEMLGSKYIRVFSFYAPEGENIADYSGEVLSRMSDWVQMLQSQKRPVVLAHENEKKIYGDIPERCQEIMERLYGPAMVNCYDPANYTAMGLTNVFETCWEPLKKYTRYLHLKDYKAGEGVVPCGKGDGCVEKTIVEAYQDGFDGFMTLEPHLKKSGQFKGFSGPDLFIKAVDAVKDICDRNEIPLN